MANDHVLEAHVHATPEGSWRTLTAGTSVYYCGIPSVSTWEVSAAERYSNPTSRLAEGNGLVVESLCDLKITLRTVSQPNIANKPSRVSAGRSSLRARLASPVAPTPSLIPLGH
jgi:hypothetical protein